MIFWEREREREKEREKERERELPIHELVTAIFSFQNTIHSSAISGVFIKLIDKLAKERKTKAIQDFIYWIREIQINIGSETSQEDSLVYSLVSFCLNRIVNEHFERYIRLYPTQQKKFKKKQWCGCNYNERATIKDTTSLSENVFTTFNDVAFKLQKSKLNDHFDASLQSTDRLTIYT